MPELDDLRECLRDGVKAVDYFVRAYYLTGDDPELESWLDRARRLLDEDA